MAQDPNTASGKTFTMPPPPEDARTSLLSNILAIAGFIIVIVIVIWGLVHLANLSRDWFGSFFGTSGESIAITLPETAESGKAFDLTWKDEPTVAGSYAFLYQCANGLQFRTPSPVGTMNEVACGAAYTIPSDGSRLSLTPFLTGTSSLSVPLSIIFLPSTTGTQAQGSAAITVIAKVSSAPSAPTTPSTNGQASYSPPVAPPTPTPVPRPKTPADLSVRIISVVPDQYGATTVTFDIANIGGTPSGVYYFTAQLPTNSQYGGAPQPYIYNSPAQASLTPGSHIVNTLRFTQVQPGGGMFSVSVDPTNAVRESNESNNYATQFVNAAYMPQNYNYSYPSPYAQGYGGTQYTQYYPYAY